MTKLYVPNEIRSTLDNLDPYVSVCFYELINNTSLSAMNQRKHRILSSNGDQCGEWHKLIHIGLAVDLYKTCKLMNDKEAY